MPRPPELVELKVVSFSLEKKQWEKLKFLSEQRGVSMSKLVREIIEEYLTSEGILTGVKQPVGGGPPPHQVLLERLNRIQLQECIVEAELLHSEMKKLLEETIRYGRRQPPLRYYDVKENLQKTVRKALKIARTMRHPPEESLKKLIELIETSKIKTI